MVLLFLLRLPILLSLSPTVTSLAGFSCRPPSLMVRVFVFGVFLSVAAVLSYSSLLGVTWALAEPTLGVCSACPGTPVVLPLSVMQLAALLRFHYWLTQVG